jgi:hypothetical protein
MNCEDSFQSININQAINHNNYKLIDKSLELRKKRRRELLLRDSNKELRRDHQREYRIHFVVSYCVVSVWYFKRKKKKTTPLCFTLIISMRFCFCLLLSSKYNNLLFWRTKYKKFQLGSLSLIKWKIYFFLEIIILLFDLIELFRKHTTN